MIKINLLGVAPPSSRMPSVGGPPASMITQVVMFLVSLIICFGIVGVIYRIWSNQIADLEKARNREKLRQTELAGVRAQNEKYKKLGNDLETRINTIQALQNSRVGPVELMSALGSVVSKTNDIYLYTLAPAGERLELKGQSSTVDSLANFLAFLKSSGFFNDVQLEQFYEDDVHERLTYKFSLSCQFISPSAKTTSAAGGAPAGPGGPGSTQGAPAQAQAPKHGL
jgi:Tfp pilus assembly protein PilN